MNTTHQNTVYYKKGAWRGLRVASRSPNQTPFECVHYTAANQVWPIVTHTCKHKIAASYGSGDFVTEISVNAV